MKALKRTRAISLGAILLLMVCLWPAKRQRGPATPSEVDVLPRQTLSRGAFESNPAVRSASDQEILNALSDRQRRPTVPPTDRSVGFPSAQMEGMGAKLPPPNPHAAPPWQDRVPHGFGQMERGLFVVPVFRDREQ